MQKNDADLLVPYTGNQLEIKNGILKVKENFGALNNFELLLMVKASSIGGNVGYKPLRVSRCGQEELKAVSEKPFVFDLVIGEGKVSQNYT